jgi:Phosphotransferase enzyme family
VAERVARTTTAPPVVRTLAELTGEIEERWPLAHSDSKSGAHIERVVIAGRSYVLKRLDLADDWTLRAVGDLGCASLVMWERGLFERLPDCLNQPIVGVAHDPSDGPGGRGTWLLMEEVEGFVPAGDAPVPLEQHVTFLDHMATMHATFWEAGDEIDIVPASNRYLEMSPWLALTEDELGSDALVPRLVGDGWPRFEALVPEAAAIVMPLAWDPGPLVEALARTPTTFVHGNWKFGNLGTDGDGRTIVVDWETPGRGAPCAELAWYLAINTNRLPHSKEEAIAAYREALERHGIDTAGWWDVQIALALLGALVQFGWEKALGGMTDELAWWCDRAIEAAPLVDRA